MYLIIQFIFYATWHLMIMDKECQEHMTITFQAKKKIIYVNFYNFFIVCTCGEHEFHMV